MTNGIGMRFSFWYYASRFGGLLFPLVGVGVLLGDRCPAIGVVGRMALALLVPLCLAGVWGGILMAMGRLGMTCPFCARPGPVGGNRADGMWLDCDQCGFVHGTGFLRLKLVGEGTKEDGGCASVEPEGKGEEP